MGAPRNDLQEPLVKRFLVLATVAVAGTLSAASPSSAVDACVAGQCVRVEPCGKELCGPNEPPPPPVDCVKDRFGNYVCW